MDCKKPQNLGDFFDNTFKLVGATFRRSLTVSVLFIVPGSVLLTVGLTWFYSALGSMQAAQQSGEGTDAGQSIELVTSLAAMLPGLLLFGWAYAVAKTASLRIVCGEINEEQIAWKDAIRQAFDRRVWKLIGQALLELAMYVGLSVVLIFIVGMVASASLGLGGVLIFLLVITMLVVISYCAVRWFFTGQALVWEDRNVFESFSRSGELIAGNWWRVFGVVFLFSLLIGFSQMLITTPLMFLTNWNYYSLYFQSGGMQNGETDPALAGAMLRSIGLTIGVYVAVSSIFTMMFEPVYRSLMYFDLRARRGEFTEQESSRPFASYFETHPRP